MEDQPLNNEEINETLEAVFDLEGVEHETVEKYRPQFLDKGGEQIVYEVPDHPDIVAKVNVESLKGIIDWNIHHGKAPNSFSEEIKQRAEKILREEMRRCQELRTYFGSEHIPKQKQYLIQVPLTPEILDELYDNNPPIMTDAAWSITTIQERIDEIRDPSRLALVGGYTEKIQQPLENYSRVTEHLVFGKDLEEKLTRDEFLQIQGNEDLKNLLEKSAGDLQLKTVLQELIEKIILYTNNTGEILDLAGHDNIIMYLKDDAWSYTLVDAKYPGNNAIIESLKLSLEKLMNGPEIEEHDENILLNAFNYIRTVNGIAEQLDSKARIHVTPDITDLKIDFQTLLRKNFQETTKTEESTTKVD